MRDDNGLRRQWTLMRALCSRRAGLTLREMSQELQVTDRTIRRDLDQFRSVGLPLEESVGDYGRKSWRLKSGREQPALGFAFDEAVALLLGRRLLEPLAGTPFGDASRRAFQKIRASLGAEAIRYIDRFSDMFLQTGIAGSDFSSNLDLIDALQVAMEDGKQSRILYRSERSTVATARDVCSCGFVYHRGSLYLVAFDPCDAKVKHFKVDRIESAEVGAAPSRLPEGFNLKAHMADAFAVYRGDGEPTTIKVRFGVEAARYVLESRRHVSQRSTPLSDGSVLAEFRVVGTAEIKSWILSFGAKAEVVEPESLRREVVAELKSLVLAYTGSVRSVVACEPTAPSRRRSRQADVEVLEE